MHGFPGTPVFFAQNVSSAAVALSGVSDEFMREKDVNFMRIVCETNAIRYRWDGTSPVASVGGGLLLPVNTPMNVNGTKAIKNFRMIRSASGDSVISVMMDKTPNAGGLV